MQRGAKDNSEQVWIKRLKLHPGAQILNTGFLASKLSTLGKFFLKNHSYIGVPAVTQGIFEDASSIPGLCPVS